MSIRAPLAAALFALAAGAAAAQGDRPLSAIDWLSDSVSQPLPPVPADESDIAENAAPESVRVTLLEGPSLDAVGLLPPAVTGLPAQLWGASATEELARMLRAGRTDALPAVQDLYYTLLLAELDPPQDADGTGALLLARLDKLLEMGALDQAQALLERAGPTNPALFRRWFDVALLLGHEDRACAAMRAAPGIAPTFPARVFCLARGGDWNAAALTLETGKVLGYLDAEEEALLARFLELVPDDPEKTLDVPVRPSPLVFRMMEAIGEPLPTTQLPLAFAQADMRPTTGWKAQIEAAERLARAGAIEPNRLLGVYTHRLPAASGGVWDRVDAVQEFDVAILSRDPGAVSRSLPPAWQAMQQAELEVPFARLYGERLARLPLAGEAATLAFRIGLLSGGFEAIAAGREPVDAEEAFLKAVARGELGGAEAPGATAAAIADGFARTELSPAMEARLAGDRLGEAVLAALELVSQGAGGDIADTAEGLALLRRVGLEEAARRAALELLILERRG